MMTMPELEERIAVLEANQVYMKNQLEGMNETLTELRDLMLTAKGAKWAILGVASIAGFMSGKLGAVIAAFGFKM
jgi:predicted trehalose synthase